MKKIKISVLMSVYSKEKTKNLKEAIDSILGQTLLPFEFVIVKDGPLTDELNKLLEKYNSNNKIIKIIELPKNVGLGNALAEGIKYCSGEYIARMDSDDISVKDRLERQTKFILKNPDCDIVGGNIIEFDDITEKDISIRKVPESHEEIKEFLKKRNPMNHVTVIFKKNSVLKVGNYKDCLYFEDYYLWARMIESGMKFMNMNDVLVRVRAGIGMSGRRGNFNYIKCIINFQKKLYKLNLIKFRTFILNIFIRVIVALIPNKLRYFIYQEKLRNEKTN